METNILSPFVKNLLKKPYQQHFFSYSIKNQIQAIEFDSRQTANVVCSHRKQKTIAVKVIQWLIMVKHPIAKYAKTKLHSK